MFGVVLDCNSSKLQGNNNNNNNNNNNVFIQLMLLFTLDFFFLNFQISVVFLVSFCWLLGYELGS